mmetsp:Transcript_6502/g.23146  ORF Transcript_6502/g.23146 Transcript_6502/m.23146 type:complete len:205 (-) Transcript_6502:660-1274(-)
MSAPEAARASYTCHSNEGCTVMPAQPASTWKSSTSDGRFDATAPDVACDAEIKLWSSSSGHERYASASPPTSKARTVTTMPVASPSPSRPKSCRQRHARTCLVLSTSQTRTRRQLSCRRGCASSTLDKMACTAFASVTPPTKAAQLSAHTGAKSVAISASGGRCLLAARSVGAGTALAEPPPLPSSCCTRSRLCLASAAAGRSW